MNRHIKRSVTLSDGTKLHRRNLLFISFASILIFNPDLTLKTFLFVTYEQEASSLERHAKFGCLLAVIYLLISYTVGLFSDYSQTSTENYEKLENTFKNLNEHNQNLMKLAEDATAKVENLEKAAKATGENIQNHLNSIAKLQGRGISFEEVGVVKTINNRVDKLSRDAEQISMHADDLAQRLINSESMINFLIRDFRIETKFLTFNSILQFWGLDVALPIILATTSIARLA